jgi:hypothetical protein
MKTVCDLRFRIVHSSELVSFLQDFKSGFAGNRKTFQKKPRVGEGYMESTEPFSFGTANADSDCSIGNPLKGEASGEAGKQGENSRQTG